MVSLAHFSRENISAYTSRLVFWESVGEDFRV
jgi:hypothetical protein